MKLTLVLTALGCAVAWEAGGCGDVNLEPITIGGAGGTPSSTSTSASTSTTTTSSGTSSGGGATACSDVSQCAGMDTDCQARACRGGLCQLDYAMPGAAVAAQTSGDCQKVVCDGHGNTTSQQDDADLPDDKNDCATAGCAAGQPTFTNKPKATACTSGGGAHCNDVGQCVECLSSSDCSSGVCSAMNACVAAQCDDAKKNGAETDIDCGGTACPRCAAGKACLGDGDCASMTCTSGVCAATCFDLATDGQETDVDCGGADCAACASGKHCLGNADCQSGSCVAGKCRDVLVLAQVQTRGDNGANDEFVELYNPTSVAVTFDASWAVEARGALGGVAACANNSLAQRFTGASQIIPAHGHILYVNNTVPAYNGPTPGDGTYTTGIPDAAAVVLLHGNAIVDALCFSYDQPTLDTLTTCPAAYPCEGAPVGNPHNNTSSSNADKSLERLPGGPGGNGVDTNDNASDFVATTPSVPHNLASPPTP